MGEEWGLTGLLISSFLAATILPFSSEALFVTLLGFGFDPMSCLIVATAGNTAGGFTNLLLGRFSRQFFDKKGRIPKGEELIRRYGAWIAWISWVPFIGDPLLIAAGFYRIPFITTTIFMFLGKLLRYATLWYVFSLTQ